MAYYPDTNRTVAIDYIKHLTLFSVATPEGNKERILSWHSENNPENSIESSGTECIIRKYYGYP